jgi:S1-C subfamily serine protease
VSCRAGTAALLAAVAAGCGGAERPSVVSVLGTGSERTTGFAVGPGLVVTVAHALPSRSSVRIEDPARRARVVRSDPRLDLALLAVRGLGGPDVETTAVEAGDSVRLLLLRGGGLTERPATVRRAIDAHLKGPGAAPPQRRPALVLDVRVRAGDSGSPVLTDDGRVAGIVFARSRRDGETAYAVDARVLVEFLAEEGG